MPNLNVNLEDTVDVTFNSNPVDFLYLNTELIWQRISPLALLTEASTALSPDPILIEAGEELETES